MLVSGLVEEVEVELQSLELQSGLFEELGLELELQSPHAATLSSLSLSSLSLSATWQFKTARIWRGVLVCMLLAQGRRKCSCWYRSMCAVTPNVLRSLATFVQQLSVFVLLY